MAKYYVDFQKQLEKSAIVNIFIDIILSIDTI